MIIPAEEMLIEIYHCYLCGKTYLLQKAPKMNCLVYHPPGTCCHYGEMEITEKELSEIELILKIPEGIK